MTATNSKQHTDAIQDTVDVAAIMREVRRRIKERHERQTDQELRQALGVANEQWEKVYQPLKLAPARSPQGRIWRILSSRFHAEVRSYLDPMIFRQVEFNASIVRVLNQMFQRNHAVVSAADFEALRDEVIQLRERLRQLEERSQE